MGNLITVDEQEFERRVRRIVRSEMAKGLRIVPTAANDLDDEPEDDGSAARVGSTKKKRSGKKKKKAAARQAKKKRQYSQTSVAAREEIYRVLKGRDALRVKEIVEITSIVQGTVNAHLNVLVKQKRVARLQEGTIVRYRAVRNGKMGRKTAPKPGAVVERLNSRESVPPASVAKPVAA
jgi:DNA-binding transcriptional ArsR family regulator